MPRKNGNAGQPNRQAQIFRRAARKINSKRFSPVREKYAPVLGPGSKDLLRTRIVYKVDA